MAKAPAMSEADLCKAFIALATAKGTWVAYPETAGFDILLVRKNDGAQIGVEAKLKLNPLVVAQALPESRKWYGEHTGPDFRAVLVPGTVGASGLSSICSALGITVIGLYEVGYRDRREFAPHLPDEETYGSNWNECWHEWAPAQRCPLPDYVPDCAAGAASPTSLTAWKVKAIKLAILLEERPIGRSDFQHLDLSPSRWTGPDGWLERTGSGWVSGPRTPNFRAQHPRNYAEIKADKAKWAPARWAPSHAASEPPPASEQGAPL